MGSIDIITLSVGPLQENCYLIGNPETGEALVIDPGDEAYVILDEAESREWTIKWIALTHGHFDHIGAAAALRRVTGAPVAASPEEIPMLSDPVLSGAALFGFDLDPVSLDTPLSQGTPWSVLGREWIVLRTPGHTAGHISLYCAAEKSLFSGDVLFSGGVGRTDLPGGSWKALMHTLRHTIFTLPDETTVYPGHGPSTTLETERRYNAPVRQALADDPDPEGPVGFSPALDDDE